MRNLLIGAMLVSLAIPTLAHAKDRRRSDNDNQPSTYEPMFEGADVGTFYDRRGNAVGTAERDSYGVTHFYRNNGSPR